MEGAMVNQRPADDEVNTGSGSDRSQRSKRSLSRGRDPVATAPGSDLTREARTTLVKIKEGRIKKAC